MFYAWRVNMKVDFGEFKLSIITHFINKHINMDKKDRMNVNALNLIFDLDTTRGNFIEILYKYCWCNQYIRLFFFINVIIQNERASSHRLEETSSCTLHRCPVILKRGISRLTGNISMYFNIENCCIERRILLEHFFSRYFCFLL